MRQALFTTLAQQDAAAIAQHIAERNMAAAHRFVDSLGEKCDILAQSPELGRVREELTPGLRSLPLGSYLIFYHVVPTGIEIIRVVHGARDLPTLFSA